MFTPRQAKHPYQIWQKNCDGDRRFHPTVEQHNNFVNETQRWFSEFWLSGGETAIPSDMESKLAAEIINLNRYFLQRCDSHSSTAKLLSEARTNGYPPIPEIAKHLGNLTVEGAPEYNFCGGDRKGDRLLWENLEGHNVPFLGLMGMDASHMAGAEKILSEHIYLENLTGENFLDAAPKLASDPNEATAAISMLGCNDMTRLGETAEKYLSTAKADNIQMTLYVSRINQIEASLLKFIASNFGKAILNIQKSRLPPYFLEGNPEAVNLISDGEMAVFWTRGEPWSYHMYGQMAKHSFCLISATPALKNARLMEKYGLPVYWQPGKDPQGASQDSLEW